MATISGQLPQSVSIESWNAILLNYISGSVVSTLIGVTSTYQFTGLSSTTLYQVLLFKNGKSSWKSSSPYSLGDVVQPLSSKKSSIRYQAVFPGGDSLWNNTTLLMHCDGSEGSGTYVDSSPSNATIYGAGTYRNAYLTTSQKKFGTASIYFDLIRDPYYIVFRVNTYSGIVLDYLDFSIDLWFRTPYPNNFQTLLCRTPDTASWTGIQRGYNLYLNGGSLNFYSGNSDKSVGVRMSGGTILADTWHHACISREGSSWILFLDGNVVAETTSSFTVYDNATYMYLGYNPSDSTYFYGYMDEIRITKGVCRYRSKFEVPTEASLNNISATGSSPPSWPLGIGETVVDGTVTWKNVGLSSSPLVIGPIKAT